MVINKRDGYLFKQASRKKIMTERMKRSYIAFKHNKITHRLLEVLKVEVQYSNWR